MSPDGGGLQARSPRIGNLSRVDDILRECRRVYRMARAGEIETQEMSRYVNALHTMVAIMRNNQLEERIEKLELAQRGRT